VKIVDVWNVVRIGSGNPLDRHGGPDSILSEHASEADARRSAADSPRLKVTRTTYLVDGGRWFVLMETREPQPHGAYWSEDEQRWMSGDDG